jgi:hypothetical protein
MQGKPEKRRFGFLRVFGLEVVGRLSLERVWQKES